MTPFDFRRAATIAQDAPFPTTLTMLPEGVEILIQAGDIEAVHIVGWDQLDGCSVGLAHWVTETLDRFRHQRDGMLAAASGIRPLRPERRLP